MKNDSLEAVYKIIDEHVSEFKNYKDYSMWYGSNPYLHTGIFGEFLVEKIKNQEIGLVKKIFDFINTIFEDPDVDESIKVMFHIEIFEILPASNKFIKISREYLRGPALASFNGVLGDFVPRE